jgi:molybdopterin synthase catalytic subunit
MDFVTRDPIDVGALVAAVADSALGGSAVFLGSVRGGGEDGPVEAIDYTAYEAMLEAEFAKIVAETVSRWPDARVTGVHRLGLVPVGDVSIALVAAAPHRAEAFAACRHAVEEAKKRLPVWKKEIFTDGTAAWRDNDQTETEIESSSA